MRAALLLAVVACGCGEPRDGRVVRVAAASSLRELCERTAPEFEKAHPGTRLVFSFEASSTLARQIREGAAYHVFLSADARTVEAAGPRAGEARPFLANRLALVSDASGKRGTVAVCAPEVPAGRAWKDRMPPGRAAWAENVRAALTLFESGAADQACVYETEARLAKRPHTVEFPYAPGVVYVQAAVGEADPTARAYLEWMRGGPALRVAESLGFRRAP